MTPKSSILSYICQELPSDPPYMSCIYTIFTYPDPPHTCDICTDFSPPIFFFYFGAELASGRAKSGQRCLAQEFDL